jgi:hypothetical protein
MSNVDIETLYGNSRITPGTACVRLLRVLASSFDPDRPIRCELSVADLDTKPVYCAISYVWGTEALVPKNVICDGVALTVTDNCYAALHSLRGRLGSFVIWIDALCINQQDDRDKEQQIKHTGKIYANACTTYIWIGEGDATTKKVFEYLSYAGFLQYCFGDTPRTINPRPRSAFTKHTLTRWISRKSYFPYHIGCQFMLLAALCPRSLTDM